MNTRPKIETDKERSTRIVKNLMFSLNYQSITDMSNDLGVPYMQVYYAYNGTVNNLSNEFIGKVLDKYPNVNELFLRKGEEPVFIDDVNSISRPSEDTVTGIDMLNLIDRLTVLFEKVQTTDQYLRDKEESLRERELHVVELEQRLLEALNRFNA